MQHRLGNRPLSGDEIIFGEIKVREPERRLRPDRDRRFAALAYEVANPTDLPIFLDRRAADAIERHALSDTGVELGGILLGKECLDQQTGQPFVWITQSLEAKHYANTQASFTYTHDSWEEITRDRDQRFPDHDIVGWYHTHPSFGIFLSHHDLFIHEHFFAQPLQVAYVVDPINQTRGFFQWRDGGMAQVAGYYLTADRGDRIALARLANELENVPNPDSNAGGPLSPRLEAELINMLTRPAQRDITSPVERAQFAAVVGLLGMFLGMLIVAAGFWLFQLHGRMQEQTESLQGLTRVVEQSTTSQRLVGDALLEKVAGQKPVGFDALYDKAYKAREEAQHQLGIQRTINETLGARTKELESRASTLAADLEATRKERDQYEKGAHEASDLRDRIAGLKDHNERQQRKLDEMAPFFESPEGAKALDVQKELVRTRYIAYAGWICSALLGLGLVAGYLYYKPLHDDDVPADELPPIEERPTHRIE
jgi:proteasome lid subunit RPN8/RPN11